MSTRQLLAGSLRVFPRAMVILQRGRKAWLQNQLMRYLDLDVNLLVVLDALLTDPHVTRVAERLSVTQPSMSGSLARLRDHFGDELIVRVGRQMELTPLAKELRTPVRDLVVRAERILATRASFDPITSERCFTLSCTDYVWMTLVGPVIRRLQVEAPRVRVEYAGTTLDFDERRTELLIVADRFVLPNLPSRRLFEDPLVCVVSSESGLHSVTEEDYFALGHVVAHSARLLDEWLEQCCHRRRTFVARVPSHTLVPQVIVGSPYIATIPYGLARLYASYLPLRIIAPPLAFPPLVCTLQWHGHQDADAGLQWFREVICQSAERLESPAIPFTSAHKEVRGGPEP